MIPLTARIERLARRLHRTATLVLEAWELSRHDPVPDDDAARLEGLRRRLVGALLCADYRALARTVSLHPGAPIVALQGYALMAPGVLPPRLLADLGLPAARAQA